MMKLFKTMKISLVSWLTSQKKSNHDTTPSIVAIKIRRLNFQGLEKLIFIESVVDFLQSYEPTLNYPQCSGVFQK